MSDEKLYAVLMRGTNPNAARTVAVVDNQEIIRRFAADVAAEMSVGDAERVHRQIEGEGATRVHRIAGRPEVRLLYEGEQLVTATGELAARFLERVHEDAEPLSTDLPNRRTAELVVGRSGSKAVTQDGTPAIVAAFVEEYSASAEATPGEVDLLRPVLAEIQEAARLEARDREQRAARIEARQARQDADRELERAQARLDEFRRLHGFGQVSDAQLAEVEREVQGVERRAHEAARALRATEEAANG